MFFFPAELATEVRNAGYFYTEWILGARYFFGYQFSRSSRDSVFVFLPYSETFFFALRPLPVQKKFDSSALGSGKFCLSSFVRCNFFGQCTVVIKVLLYCRVADK